MIVVFGSVGVDIVAVLPRFPRPGETIACPSYDIVAGTKGANQALAAARAGALVAHIASRGDDAFGTVAISLLTGAGVDLSRLAIVDVPTGACLITVDSTGENTVVAAASANLSTTMAQLGSHPFGRADTLVLQREIPDEQTFAAIRLSRERGARTILNVAPAGPVPGEILRLLDILVVNEHEALIVGAALGLAESDPETIGSRLAEIHGCAVVVTLGGDGAVAWSGGERTRVAALSVDVRDTTAAGDSFIGFFAAALDAGHDFATALRRGAAAGSLCCAGAGAQTSIPWRADVDAALAPTSS